MIVIYPLFHEFLGQIKDLVNQYMIEASAGQYDYVKALAEFSRYRFIITYLHPLNWIYDVKSLN